MGIGKWEMGIGNWELGGDYLSFTAGWLKEFKIMQK